MVTSIGISFILALIGKSNWVLLDKSAIDQKQATLIIDGDLITYRYPLGLLEDNKNLVYDNGSDEIFKIKFGD